MKKKLLVYVCSFFVACNVFAQSGTIDSSFADEGVINLGTGTYALSMVSQPDGKIIATGYSYVDAWMARYNENGSLDESFGTNGIVTPSFGDYILNVFEAVALQPDGKIVVAGHLASKTLIIVARYTQNGQPDTSFGVDGKVIIDWDLPSDINSTIKRVNVYNDGKIAFFGKYNGQSGSVGYSVRLNTDGVYDLSYGTDGVYSGSQDSNIFDLNLQFDNIITLSEYHDYDINAYITRLTRTNQISQPDLNFNESGTLTMYPESYEFKFETLRTDEYGITYLGGWAEVDGLVTFATAKVAYNGSFVEEYGIGGIAVGDSFGIVSAMEFQADGKLLCICNANNNIRMTRFDTYGNVDTTFGADGSASFQVNFANQPFGMHILSNGKFLISHVSQIYRLNNNITASAETFNANQVMLYPNPVSEILNLLDSQRSLKEVTISDSTGKTILTQTGNITQIDVQQLPAGMYFIEIKTDTGASHHKFIKE